MAKNKLRRFDEMKEMSHVFEPTIAFTKTEKWPLKGKWAAEFFKNDHPIVLELGCGKGEYTVGLARKYPEKNFIGIDIKGARMWVGAKSAQEEGLKNVVFLRTKIDFIEAFFGAGEIAEIWLTFSDPQPQKPRKRLTSAYFIQKYREILVTGGIVHLKTDSDLLFEFTEEEIKTHGYKVNHLTWDVYRDLSTFDEDTQAVLAIKTHYESLFSEKGAVIKYTQFNIH